MLGKISSIRYFSVAMIGFLGVFSFLGTTETPEEAVKRFVRVFTAQDSLGLMKMIQPEIIDEKEIGPKEVEAFLTRYHGRSQRLETFRIDQRLRSDDGKTDRFQATLVFRGPALSARYSGPSTLEMSLLWVFEQGKWWLERPLSISYHATSTAPYPTSEQNEVAMRFRTALQILDKIGMLGKADLPLAALPTRGIAVQAYRELERLHKGERGPGGVDANARGVTVMLKAASRTQGGFLKIYHGDFSTSALDQRRAVPWDMFRDYILAAINRAKKQEKIGEPEKAEMIYRRIISLGRQFLDEPGGLHFVTWGLTFQRMGALELARLLDKQHSPEKGKVREFIRLTSRRLDLIRTAFNCLDDMADYRALEAATIAAARVGDVNFRPWGINTLAIFALKGAPARSEVIRKAGGMVLVTNPVMQRTASTVLDEVAAASSARIRSFIEHQKEWVRTHTVYGKVQAFR